MSLSRTLSNEQNLRRLADNLQRVSKVTELDTKESDESWNLTRNLEEIEAACEKLVDELIPTLVDSGATDDEIYDALLDIGEEFRQLVYHIFDNQFYRYLPLPGIANETQRK
jgi:mannitol-1-phosphate/altronate dehydrogenase